MLEFSIKITKINIFNTIKKFIPKDNSKINSIIHFKEFNQ